ncbi:hypothetical protein [Fictibacillus barbaricus]|uniref:Amino acid transporter n=1 Tax=Fictibacillus barbaricus TaxID=182136 RepID=A0ABS2ZF43_9BACL|nr:hypothetical protein [Fictibacillus barbaricus]MBN3546813.1 hypothetical protein [Fictibacillus barbaricus]GGB43994.1 hypothetical protein GCM10007199_06710 [Fictibacillus barbaricus]
MAEEVEKVKKRVDKRLEQSNSPKNGEVPFNDVIDHMRQIEGYPTKNLSKVNLYSLLLPIRILGYLLIGSMGLGTLIVIILMLFK